jgi:transcriptional regulator with XRE-family HTH domain
MSMSLADAVSSEVRAEMGRQRVTGAQLARELAVSQSYVSRRLTGVKEFEMAELERIAVLLGLPGNHFFARAAAVIATVPAPREMPQTPQLAPTAVQAA